MLKKTQDEKTFTHVDFSLISSNHAFVLENEIYKCLLTHSCVFHPYLLVLCFLRFFIQTEDRNRTRLRDSKTKPTLRITRMESPPVAAETSHHSQVSSVQLYCHYVLVHSSKIYVYIPYTSQTELWVLFPGNSSASPSALHLLTRNCLS